MRTKLLTYGFCVLAVILFPLVAIVASLYASQLMASLGGALDNLFGSLPSVRAIASSSRAGENVDPPAVSSIEAEAMVRAAAVSSGLTLAVIVMGAIHLVGCVYIVRKHKNTSNPDPNIKKGWRAWVIVAICLLAAAAFVGYGMTSETLLLNSGVATEAPLWWVKLCLLNVAALWCVVSAGEAACTREYRAV